MNISLRPIVTETVTNESNFSPLSIHPAACLTQMLRVRTSMRCSLSVFQAAAMVLHPARAGSRRSAAPLATRRVLDTAVSPLLRVALCNASVLGSSLMCKAWGSG